MHLVGGAVRDLLLGRVPRELDIVVEGDVAALAAALGDAAATHERFGTAMVSLGDCRWDSPRRAPSPTRDPVRCRTSGPPPSPRTCGGAT